MCRVTRLVEHDECGDADAHTAGWDPFGPRDVQTHRFLGKRARVGALRHAAEKQKNWRTISHVLGELQAIQVLQSFGGDWKSNPVPNLFKLGRTDRAEEGCRNSTPVVRQVAAFLFFPFSVRVDASHPRSLVLNKFLDSVERERCEGLKREWFSVPQHVDCVSAFASRHWFSVCTRSV